MNRFPEELAEWHEKNASCELCPATEDCCGYGDNCRKAWLAWMKKEAKDD